MAASQFDPHDPGLRTDPYLVYDRLRAHAPISYCDEWATLFLTRHEDCSHLLRDPRLGHEEFVPMSGPLQSLSDMQAHWMLIKNPPDHTRLRGLVHKAFTPARVERMRDSIQQITDRLLDRVQARGEMELIADLAYPLAVTVIATMLGVPPEDHHQLRGWSNALARVTDIVEDPALFLRASEAAHDFTLYLGALFDERRRHPRDDFLSALVAVEEAGDILSKAEMEATCALLLGAGHETTYNLIGNGTLALLRHPDQLRLLRRSPDLIADAIEEALRFDSPVQMTARVVLEETHLGDHLLRPGQRIGFLIGAANRDPARFDHPNRLDITRKPNPHLAFGGGIHYCLGAPLARLEAQIAISTLLRRMPNLALAIDTPVYRDSYVLRSLETLPLTF